MQWKNEVRRPGRPCGPVPVGPEGQAAMAQGATLGQLPLAVTFAHELGAPLICVKRLQWRLGHDGATGPFSRSGR